jgi:phenylacetate-CoA ligase
LFRGLRRLHWSEQKLKEYEEKRLRTVIRYAYEFVPFYHEKFKIAGVSPSEIRDLDDLTKLPIVKKDELRNVDCSKLVSKEYSIAQLRVLRTSGSTGTPFKSYVSQAEDDWSKSIYLRANVSCGQHPRDRWVFVTSPHNFASTTQVQRKLGIYSQDCVSVFNSVDEQLRLVREAKARVLDGYSGALFLLAKEVEKRGIEDVRPRLMFGSADLIDAHSRQHMEKIFGAPYHDQYGCSEVNRTAWQCPKRDCYHMDVDSVITEFVNDDGDRVSAGESGHIVHTSLFNFAMPFIRYSIGDVGIPSDEVCSCGRVLPLMKLVEGRRDSFVVLSDGRILSPRAFTVAMSGFESYDCIDQFRIVQRKPDVFDVLLKLKSSDPVEKVIEERLESHFAKTLALPPETFVFNVKFVDHIPLNESGKLMAVVSDVKPTF